LLGSFFRLATHVRPHMKPAISQVCSLESTFERDLEDYAAGACRAVEVWLGKLERFLETHRLEEACPLAARHEVVLPAASFQGGLLASAGDARRQTWDHFARRLHYCRMLGIETLVVACDVPRPIDRDMLERVRFSLAEAARQARAKGVRLALEPQAGSALGNNVATVASLVAETGSPHLGVCLDVFHYYLGPSKPEDLRLLDAENLFHVQLSDLAGTPREFATDSDRILPGEGDFDLQPILQRLADIGYSRYISIELMNPQLWRVPPRQFGEVAITALRKLLGQASMD
ncbi:MAG: sugar phosphate isomerase/epimerase, partial [Pirellulales bacterium]|nr:sugar phosphate isomerase/epimerase [Pirellulales bacterium]